MDARRGLLVVGVVFGGCASELMDVAGAGAPSPVPEQDTIGIVAPVARPAAVVPAPLPDAPTADVEWWRQVGSTSIDHASALAVDAAGGLVVAGELRDTVDFGGQTVSALGAGDAFVARYTADGALSWVVGLGSARAGSDNAEATDVALGPDGLVVVTGTYEGELEVVTRDATALAPLVAVGRSDVFVVALDAFGAPLWAHAMGSDSSDEGGGVTVDGSGRVIAAAEVGYTTRIDVLARDGSLVWSRSAGRIQVNYSNVGAVQSVGADARGDLFVTGMFNGTTSLGGEPLRSAGGGDVFVAKLSGLDGSHLWSRRVGSPLSVIAEVDDAWDLVVTADGDVVVAGDFNGPIDFGAGVVEAARAGFVARLAGDDGSHVWSRVLDGDGFVSVTTLSTTLGGEIVAGGSYTFGISFGSLAAAGDGAFLLRMDATDGATRGASVIGAAPGSRTVAVAIAPTGRAYVSLDFYGELDAGGERWTSRGFSDFLLGHTTAP